MHKLFLTITIILGILPILILYPYGNCSSVFVELYGLASAAIFYLFVIISLISIYFLNKKGKNIQTKTLTQLAILFLFIHIAFAIYKYNPFKEKADYIFHSDMDKQHYCKYELYIYKNNTYQLNKQQLFNHCLYNGVYKKEEDRITFDEKISEYSFDRIHTNYTITKDSLIPNLHRDSLDYFSFTHQN